MKVLWFSNTPANADEFLNKALVGTGGWLKALDNALQNKVDLHIAYFGADSIPFKYKNTSYYPIYKKVNFFIRNISRYINYPSKVNYLTEYLRIIKSVAPDIIHIHGTELTFGEIIVNTTIPVVVSIQGNITVYRHKYFIGIEEKGVKHFFDKKNTIGSFFLKNSFQFVYEHFNLQSINEQQYLAKCNNIIGRTDWDRRISRILAPKSKYFHCDEILREAFYSNQWVSGYPRSSNIIIHTTTGNSLYKGLETLCYALNLLNHVGYSIEWRIAGINPNDLIVSIVRHQLGKDYPSKGLVFLGNLTENELANKMLEAEIYVMPSHIENSPNSLCEAMIMGMPCISTFAGGVGSLIRDKEDGLLIQDGDPWAMAGAIAELIKDQNLKVNIGKKAREKALLRHNKEKILKELLLIYYEIFTL